MNGINPCRSKCSVSERRSGVPPLYKAARCRFYNAFTFARINTHGTWLTAILLSLLLWACQGKQESTASGPISATTLAWQKSIEMVLVPAGEFLRGSEKIDNEGIQQRYGFPQPIYVDERPYHKVNLAAFYIDKYEVTNALYKTYILESKRMIPFDWLSNAYALTAAQLAALPEEKLRNIAVEFAHLDIDATKLDKAGLIAAIENYQLTLNKLPAGNVSWFEAKAFCEWRTGRLPTEAEWEKAARGSDGREYPWGNQWDPKITNTGDDSDWEDGIAPVGSYPGNQSPYGALDMSGNVWEWVNDWYQAYPGSDYQSPLFGETLRVVRGGGGGMGHYAINYFFRAATRQYSEPEMQSADVGFRCVKDG